MGISFAQALPQVGRDGQGNHIRAHQRAVEQQAQVVQHPVNGPYFHLDSEQFRRTVNSTGDPMLLFFNSAGGRMFSPEDSL